MKSAAVFYKAHLIHSGFENEDMRIIYSYLVNLHNGRVSSVKLNGKGYGRVPTVASQAGSFDSSAFGRSHLIEETSSDPHFLTLHFLSLPLISEHTTNYRSAHFNLIFQSCISYSCPLIFFI